MAGVLGCVMTAPCKIIRLSDYRRRPEPPPNLMLAAVAWWLAWSAESAQLAADNLHAMSATLRGRR